MSDLPIVVCVAKGGIWRPREDYTITYGPQHVQWLAAQFRRNVRREHRFVCMTDMEIPGVETLPLRDELPGWWSKLEIFRTFQRACYVDLDTVLIGDPSRVLFDGHTFTVSAGIHILRNGAINSSLMCWNGDYRFLYEDFIARKAEIMAAYTCNDRWGDQGYIRDAAAGRIGFERFQQKYPGAVLNYKRDLRGKAFTPGPSRPFRVTYGPVRLGPDWRATPRIVFFNGALKPWDVREPWIPEMPTCDG